MIGGVIVAVVIAIGVLVAVSIWQGLGIIATWMAD